MSLSDKINQPGDDRDRKKPETEATVCSAFKIEKDKNFAAFKQALTEQIDEARAENYNLGVLLLHQDHAPPVQDGIYDPAISELAWVIKEEAELYDSLLVVYSSSNLAVLLPAIQPVDVADSAETIRQAVERHRFGNYGFPEKMTVSIAATVFPLNGDSAESLLCQMELCLAKAIERGGNNCNIAFENGGT
jgi:GGDEF domain-containing protein